jgi:hypothetical protein
MGFPQMLEQLALPSTDELAEMAPPFFNIISFVTRPLAFLGKSLATSMGTFINSRLILGLCNVPEATPRPATFWPVSWSTCRARSLFRTTENWLGLQIQSNRDMLA